MFKDLFTDPEQRHSDEMALCAVIGFLTFVGLSIYSVVAQGHQFDPQTYGIGMGAAIGAAAAGMGLKAKLGG